jgi:SAM-dependent methyltransferase
MKSILRKILKKFLKPGIGILQLMTKAETKMLSLVSPVERNRITQQQIDILLGHRTNLPLSQASALNNELFADIHSIPDDEWSQFEEQVRSFCRARNFPPEYTQEQVRHKYRFYLTVRWIQSMMKPDHDIVALEMGEEGIATDILRSYFPHVQWHLTEGDLRYPWQTIASESVDLIVSMEVLEHLADLPDGINHGFFKTGLKAVINECYRVLKPGGVLFITTPNAGSITHLENALVGAIPWHYRFHNREYTIYELQDEIAQAGFTIERWKAVHCMTIDTNKDHTQTFQMLLSRPYETTNRGDDLFIVAKKSG